MKKKINSCRYSKIFLLNGRKRSGEKKLDLLEGTYSMLLKDQLSTTEMIKVTIKFKFILNFNIRQFKFSNRQKKLFRFQIYLLTLKVWTF